MKIVNFNINSSFANFCDSQKVIFPKDKQTNCVFVYGKNGSGKSSIAKLFMAGNIFLDNDINFIEELSQLQTKKSSKDLMVTVNFDNNVSSTFTNKSITNPLKIPIFTQKYIDSKITYQEDFKNNKFKEKNINYSIELESKKAYLEKIKQGKEMQKNREDLELKINEKIKEEIERLKKDTATKDNNKNYSLFTLEKLKSINPKELPQIDELNARRLEHIKFIQSLKDLNEDNEISFEIEFLKSSYNILSDIQKVNRSLTFSEDEAKTSSSREILDKLDNDLKNWKLEGVSHIENDNCPFCGNDIKQNELVEMYKNYVNSKVNKMKQYLNNSISKFNGYKNEINNLLKNSKLKAEYLDKIFKTTLSADLVSFTKELSDYLDSILSTLSEKNKINNLFVDSSRTIKNIDENKLNDMISKYEIINSKIKDVNKKIVSSTSDKTKRNDEFFKTVAMYLVYYSLKNEIAQLIDMESKIKKIIEELEPLKKAYEKELNEKNILLKRMNEILSDFSITNYRIDEEFDLCLNGEKVSFCADKLLSNGEKSIIAFSLFIAELELYYSESEKSIVIIDDPISSVDYPNLYGIYNYINNLINTNKNSQFIILSHNTLFLNLFKFDYPNKKATYYKLKDENGKTKIVLDNASLDSVYLEKLKEIYQIAKTGTISDRQKLYIHNYCRYVLETISRFEYPINDDESASSKYYLNKIINNIENNITDYEISKVSLQSMIKIINKGSHATIEVVHDKENFEDNHYIDCCKAIIKFIKKDYNGQYDLLSNDYDNMAKLDL